MNRTDANGARETSDRNVTESLRVQAAQVRQLYVQGRTGLVGALIGAILVTLVLWDAVSHVRLITWVLIYVAVSIPRQLVISAYFKKAPAVEDAPAWGSRFA